MLEPGRCWIHNFLCDFLMCNEVFAITSCLCIFLHLLVSKSTRHPTKADYITFRSSDILTFQNYCSDRHLVRDILFLSLVWLKQDFNEVTRKKQLDNTVLVFNMLCPAHNTHNFNYPRAGAIQPPGLSAVRVSHDP